MICTEEGLLVDPGFACVRKWKKWMTPSKTWSGEFRIGRTVQDLEPTPDGNDGCDTYHHRR